jgi:hypothetical protein
MRRRIGHANRKQKNDGASRPDANEPAKSNRRGILKFEIIANSERTIGSAVCQLSADGKR